MRIETKKYETVNDFIMATTLPNGEYFNKLYGYIFRGESTNLYSLLPVALRNFATGQSEWEFSQIYSEYEKLREFYKVANLNGMKIPRVDDIMKNYVDEIPFEHILRRENYKWISENMSELAGLAQHYGVPTRLLDWTFDLNVALYFASIGAIKRRTRQEYRENDTMIIWALNAQHIQFLEPTESRIPLKFVVPTYADNPNLNAQKGVLTYWEIEMLSAIDEMQMLAQNIAPKMVDRRPLDELLQQYCHDEEDNHIVVLYRFEIPVQECVGLYDYISRLGYGAARLFPGYSGVAREMEEKQKKYKVMELEKDKTKS